MNNGGCCTKVFIVDFEQGILVLFSEEKPMINKKAGKQRQYFLC